MLSTEQLAERYLRTIRLMWLARRQNKKKDEKAKHDIKESIQAPLAVAVSAWKQKYPQLDLAVYPAQDVREGPAARLDTLQARRDAPPGSGTAFMKELCQWADENQVILSLNLANKSWGDWDGRKYKRTSSTGRLKQFYGRFGFVSSYGRRSYRPDIGGSMHRIPEGSRFNKPPKEALSPMSWDNFNANLSELNKARQ